MIVLGIETSCDETGVGIIEFDPAQGISSAKVLADEIASSVEEHIRYGGVVPEIASRAHLEALAPTVRRALEIAGISKPDAVAVTIGPGLIGALLVGVAAAKAYALGWGVPLYALNHLAAHIAVDTLEHGPLSTAVALLVSGGHTNLLLVNDLQSPLIQLGSTIDDAAGEAFDKVARIMGLGYPGGPAIDALAATGNPHAISFPRALVDKGDNFSFSGLKTSVARYIESHENYNGSDVAASFQEAVADILTAKAIAAAQRYNAKTIVLGGGATANTRIRSLAMERCHKHDIELRIPTPRRCTDNGVMIAALAVHYICSGGQSAHSSIICEPNLPASVIALTGCGQQMQSADRISVNITEKSSGNSMRAVTTSTTDSSR